MKGNRFSMPNAIEMLDPTMLQPPPDLIHAEDKARINQLATAIMETNVIIPILIDPSNSIIDGVNRWKAALQAGVSRIPALRVTGASDAQIKLIRLALNKLQTGARWNEATLYADISALLNQGFDVLKVGFQTGELDAILKTRPHDTTLSELCTPAHSKPIVRADDAFTIDRHSIAVGDCRDVSRIKSIMRDEIAAAIVMDAPFNVPIRGHVSGLGRNRHDEFQHGNGELDNAEFVKFLRDAMEVGQTVLKDAGYQYLFMDWRSLHLLRQAADQVGLQHVNTAVWVKSNAGMGSFYRSQHEMCGVFRKSGPHPTNNIQLGKFGRSRSNVWDCRGANSFGGTREEDLKDHPTVKPLALIEGIIKDCTKRDEIVVDLFGGSGSTMLAAEHCGRRARLVEIEPKYVEVTIRRMRAAYDIEAVHVETGLTFDQLCDQRLSEQKIKD